MSDRLATYGTLSPGRSNHHQVSGLRGTWLRGTVRGRLVADGWGAAAGFPGIVLDEGGDLVEVDVLESPDLPDHWRRLDDFEGVGYVRTSVMVQTAGGPVQAFIYALAAPPPGATSVNVMEATLEDRDVIVGLWERAGLTRPWNDAPADFERAVAGSRSTVLKALAGATVVGSAMVGDDGHRGWVYYLSVESTSRRRGIGRALMAASEEWLRSRGVTAIRLMVRRENTGVAPFYAALGYEDADCVVLGRPL